MKFKSMGVGDGGTHWWTTEAGHYVIAASDHSIQLKVRSPHSDELRSIPADVSLKDRGISAFVVRGIMDALSDMPDRLNRYQIMKVIEAYLDELCSDYKVKKPHGTWRVYRACRDDVRRYLREHADRSQSKAQL